MKIDIGTRIINNAAESRMRLAKARQAMGELREHEREMLLAEILEVEEAKVIRTESSSQHAANYPPAIVSSVVEVDILDYPPKAKVKTASHINRVTTTTKRKTKPTKKK